jgi:hypothetical protein
MASYTANAIKHPTLTASTVDTVTLGSDFNRVEVLNRGASDIYFTADKSTPTVGGDDCFIALAGGGLQVDVPTAGSTTVKLISSGAPAYTVTGV